MQTFIQGFWISVLATFPMGVVSAIAIARTLKSGYRGGFFTLLGSSSADLVAFFIILSGLSFSFAKNPEVRLIFSIIASLVTILIGFSIFKNKNKSKSNNESKSENKNGLDSNNNMSEKIEQGTNNFASGFLLTILNPYQFIIYSVFLTSLSIHYANRLAIQTFSVGAFFGSLFWAIFVPFLIVKLKEGYTEKVNKIYPYIGAVVLLAGLVLFIRALYLFFI